MTGRQPGLVAVVAGAAWSVPGFRGSERHLAEALAQDGPVLYVDPPRSPSGAVRVGLPGRVGVHVSRPEPGVTRLSIVLPGPERPGLRDIADLLLRRAVRRTAAELGHPVAGAVVAIAHRDLLDPLPGAPRLFWATDDFSAGAALMGLSGDRLRRGESRIAAARIPVLAASPELGRQWAARGCPVTLFPNGVDTARFAERPDAVRPAGPSLAVFAGQLGPRVDPALLLGVAEHVAVRLVGPRLPSADGPLWDQLLAHPRVQWTGPIEFDAVPALLADADVGLVPYVDSAFNQASFPLKAFEYLASGLPVVGTPLPALQWLAEGAPGGDQLRLAPTPAEFGRAAADLATLARNGSELRARCRALAGDHDWRLRSREVRSLLAASPERPGAPVREGER